MQPHYLDSFERRHIGISSSELDKMLERIGVDSLDTLIHETIPDNIRMEGELDIDQGKTEFEYLSDLKKTASLNKVFRSFIGHGYYGTITPSVILRNVFQNPGWYTQYTPYQAEIAQGRLEALLNFQTMVSDLTGMSIANASLLDEGTAAAETMAMFEGIRNKKRKKNPATKFFVDQYIFEQTKDILITRAKPINIELVFGDYKTFEYSDDFIGVLVQYPNSIGSVENYREFTERCHEKDILVCAIADIMALTQLVPPGEWGADAVVGNTQRFGVPMGYGGPHAAYFACKEEYKRLIPGRIIGMSIDRYGNEALRMALQTREQHIRREKATSNICTAQALLAIMASMYAVYHGPSGLKHIGATIHKKTQLLFAGLKAMDIDVVNESYYDTITIDFEDIDRLKEVTESKEINLGYFEGKVCISVDETTTEEDVNDVLDCISSITGKSYGDLQIDEASAYTTELTRDSEFCTHPVFSSHHTESKMMRYLKSLENKDLSLTHSMISLGSCTMKLNAASELIPVSWPEFANLHPFAPKEQAVGYHKIFEELSKDLSTITGFTATSLQPNSGAQGEYAGLLAIKAYHEHHNDHHRNIAIIPSSAHGTNPASAVMAGMKVVVVACDDKGNIDVEDLKVKVEQHKENLAAFLVTYPSTHGVFETAIKEMCDLIHDNGGLVYMDGANMNAQVGLTSPGIIGADVCHLNLHKTFAIPHGGGGPGMGPICVNDKLKPFLPGHSVVKTGGEMATHAVSAAPWGSASILLISYGYIKMLGRDGLLNATRYAILNANYIKERLSEAYEILYTGEAGRAAHEMIVDLRAYKAIGIEAEDVAKRLIDYGFHAPTLSFPVAGTVMIEPTESESKDELDRFCDALISIKEEIDEIARGEMDKDQNVLTNAPHTLAELSSDEWTHFYTREKAAYPLSYLKEGSKFWASVGRVNNAHGDRNLICVCPPIEEYMEG